MSLLVAGRTAMMRSTVERADAIFREKLLAEYQRVDRILAFLLMAEWLSAILVAVIISPYAWAGETASIHFHVWTAMLFHERDGILDCNEAALRMTGCHDRKMFLGFHPASISEEFQPDETLQALARRAHSKGLELVCRPALQVPDTLIGDAGRLRQVLVNLVGNAIKFTELGEILVSVGLDHVGKDEVVLRFAVADTGIGIPFEKLPTIFQPFERADGSTTRRFGGSGLGLTISAKLVELMGGRIWVESQPGIGSTFWLARLGHTGRVAPDGKEAIAAPESGDFDLVLMDNLFSWT